MRELSLGVFDSGVGGLSVVAALRRVFPQAFLVYVADQAHVPYGGRPLQEVQRFACAISEALIRAGCSALVMACNISSAVALPVVREQNPHLPIIGVVEPGAQAAAACTHTGRVGVLATEGTVRSGAYTKALLRLRPDLQVLEVACPAFVPIVEAGKEQSPQAREAAFTYLRALQTFHADTVVLGCTHYPFLLPVLQSLAPALLFVDPAEPTALQLKKAILHLPPLAPTQPHRLYTTGDADAFRAQVAKLCPELLASSTLLKAQWRGSSLLLPTP